MRQISAPVIVLTFLLCSCYDKVEYEDVNKLQETFDKDQFLNVFDEDFNVDWSYSPIFFSEELGTNYLEYPIKLKGQNTIEKGGYTINFSLIVVKDNVVGNSFYVSKFFNKTTNSTSPSFSNLTSFTGLIHILNKENELFFAKKVENGIVLDNYMFAKANTSSSNARMEVDCYTVATNHYIDWYVNGSYIDSYLQNVTYETECYSNYLPDLYLGGGGGGTYASTTGGGVYDDCGDPRHGCIYEVTDKLVIDFYTCPENFTFRTATNSNLWQEAALTNIYVNLIYWVGNTGERAIRKVTLDKVYFGLPFYNVEGQLVYNSRTASEISADVLNLAEYDMRSRFKSNPQLTSYELGQYWLERMKFHMSDVTLTRGRVDKYGSINNTVPVVLRPYTPCNSD